MTGLGGGDPAAARDLFAALLPVFERVLGLEHPHTLAPSASLSRPAWSWRVIALAAICQ
jgi:hypothetical protein